MCYTHTRYVQLAVGGVVIHTAGRGDLSGSGQHRLAGEVGQSLAQCEGQGLLGLHLGRLLFEGGHLRAEQLHCEGLEAACHVEVVEGDHRGRVRGG